MRGLVVLVFYYHQFEISANLGWALGCDEIAKWKVIKLDANDV